MLNPLPTHWVTVTQADFQIPGTCTIIIFVLFQITFFRFYLRYSNKHHYILEIFPF